MWDTVHMLNQLEGKLDDQTHTENLLAERERAFKEYRQADTPYPTVLFFCRKEKSGGCDDVLGNDDAMWIATLQN